MSFKHFVAAVLGMATLALSTASAAEVYSGEPLGEALYDLAGAATLIAHELSSGSALLRTDVFRLADGRLVAVTSRANKVGQPYSIEALRVTTSATSKLTRRLPTVAAVKLPQ
jgi:hypothetical protein